MFEKNQKNYKNKKFNNEVMFQKHNISILNLCSFFGMNY